MVIFADEYPEAWFGHFFQHVDTRKVVRIVGVTNGTQLLAADEGDNQSSPYMNVESFAKGLLSGRIRRYGDR